MRTSSTAISVALSPLVGDKPVVSKSRIAIVSIATSFSEADRLGAALGVIFVLPIVDRA
ncbi:hypothetical protein CBM2592_A10107 [Cupriavidus taiwanensis]|nr:hypothetical protein CBM2588_A10105 [Cupriavidus taiwanensis]SOY42391.1 hypothetical protein CBM2592_A10107 [Cupriavidus taiwanensis]SOY78986.1 hypothetical protein CBM2591_A10106 [Cupriavidus taiwanensis]SOZ50286.1 hypothetical protein CBM2617_A10055 [Cupriavidus taiwanensis]SOZ75651.1 hypothetical protein CBM2622_A10056 [Cupriavidus taiwanensis]